MYQRRMDSDNSVHLVETSASSAVKTLPNPQSVVGCSLQKVKIIIDFIRETAITAHLSKIPGRQTSLMNKTLKPKPKQKTPNKTL